MARCNRRRLDCLGKLSPRLLNCLAAVPRPLIVTENWIPSEKEFSLQGPFKMLKECAGSLDFLSL